MHFQSYMIDINDVEIFLSDFNTKVNIWGIIYSDGRGKNAQTLLDLELRSIDRTAIIKTLTVDDYTEGPIKEVLYGGSDMWVFGKTVKNTVVYIKITLGNQNNKTICISFHIAEHPMKYPFR